jgi:hypothetical protein
MICAKLHTDLARCMLKLRFLETPKFDDLLTSGNLVIKVICISCKGDYRGRQYEHVEWVIVLIE